jgi:hypothetical protein
MPRSRASRRSRSGSGSQELQPRGSRSRSRSHERRRSGKEKRRHRHLTPRSTTEGRSGKSRRQHPRESRTSSQRTEETVSRLSEVIFKGMSEVVRQVRPRTKVSVGTISSGILSEFNPLTGNVDDWLHAVDEYAQIYGWDDKVTSHLALAKLRGPAEVWYRGLPTHLFTWVEWKEMLRQNFIPKRDLHKLLSNMFACVPKASFTVRICFRKTRADSPAKNSPEFGKPGKPGKWEVSPTKILNSGSRPREFGFQTRSLAT